MGRASLVFGFIALVTISCQLSPNDDTSELNTVIEENIDSLMNRGKELATLTGKTLKGELMSAMKQGGVQEAINYCNVNALALTDSISENQKVRIQRIAERNRNPANTLDNASLEVFNSMKRAVQTGDKLKPIIVSSDGNEVFYAPIRLEGACLSCHGTKDQIGEENLAIIQSRYPNDKAVDFKPGDLRGMWKIEL
jgi:hypothetical protein